MLAATTAARQDALPAVPTVGEFIPGYEASGWFGIVAPKGTAATRLNTEIGAGLADPTLTSGGNRGRAGIILQKSNKAVCFHVSRPLFASAQNYDVNRSPTSRLHFDLDQFHQQ